MEFLELCPSDEDVEDSPFSADLCVAALTRFRYLTAGLLTQLRQDTMQAMVGTIARVQKSRTIANDKEKAHLQAETFCTGLQTDVGDLFRSDLTETPVTSTRLQALLLISSVLAHTNSTRLGQIIKSLEVTVDVDACEWISSRISTAIKELHVNTHLRKQLVFLVSILHLEESLNHSRSPTDAPSQRWNILFNELIDGAGGLKLGGDA